MNAVVRWTIGPVQPDGFDCLAASVASFAELYPGVERVVCHNGLDDSRLQELVDLDVRLVCQSGGGVGVAWKLYPPRLDIARHELFIDNDLIVLEKVQEIDDFFSGEFALLLQGESRNYGRFDQFVPPSYNINSGLFGVPPGIDLDRYLKLYGERWEENCYNSSRTWDEQGFVAAVLTQHPHRIVSNETIRNCELRYQPARGLHFVGLNRCRHHRPYREFKVSAIPFYM
jgi:hypothetical protein